MRTVGSFSKPEQAHLVASILEGSGVPAYVQDSHLVTMDWFYSNAIGGVRVQVADEDYARALEILRSGGE